MLAFVIATCAYSLSMSITPGPTNIIMMTTGVNHGFVRHCRLQQGRLLVL
ncbi:hypothetical protein N9D02_10875 [Emcibacteraceae bacterium]|nr:hypothetical protein [Emcibacteraceae bacterium]MDA9771525.1 hypothetical protein [Emcibacteraceae bacterium]